MASTPEEMARRFEQQTHVQREQLDMIHAQKESINTLKQMLTRLLKKKKKPKTKDLQAREKSMRVKTLTLKILTVGVPTLRI